jgi:hypothetical protein
MKMTKKERIEDLGKLESMLNQATDHVLFDLMNEIPCTRPKDFVSCFRELSPERQEEFLHNLAYKLEDLRNDLLECWNVARGDE